MFSDSEVAVGSNSTEFCDRGCSSAVLGRRRIDFERLRAVSMVCGVLRGRSGVALGRSGSAFGVLWGALGAVWGALGATPGDFGAT